MHVLLDMVSGRGYDGQQKICYFQKFNIFIALLTCSGANISRFDNFCVHDNDKKAIELIALSLAYACEVNM